MTDKEIYLVQESFQKVAPIADQAAEMFYSKLFDLDPSLKHLFNTDMKQQGKKLMAMLATAVGGLKNPDALMPTVQNLGRKHKGYDVPKDSYALVGAALIDTLSEGLGNEFTDEVREAWIIVYTRLSMIMMEVSDY